MSFALNSAINYCCSYVTTCSCINLHLNNLYMTFKETELIVKLVTCQWPHFYWSHYYLPHTILQLRMCYVCCYRRVWSSIQRNMGTRDYWWKHGFRSCCCKDYQKYLIHDHEYFAHSPSISQTFCQMFKKVNTGKYFLANFLLLTWVLVMT